MLVLTRKVGEKILVGNDIIVEVIEINRGKVRLGFSAPQQVLILREELKGNGPLGAAPPPLPQ